MTRLAVLVVVLSLTGTMPALAGETLLQSANRAALTLVRAEAPPSGAPAARAFGAGAQSGQAQLQQGGLQAAGFSKRTKILIAIGAGAAFAAVAYAIDRHVVNNTPSTLGTRKD